VSKAIFDNMASRNKGRGPIEISDGEDDFIEFFKEEEPNTSSNRKDKKRKREQDEAETSKKSKTTSDPLQSNLSALDHLQNASVSTESSSERLKRVLESYAAASSSQKRSADLWSGSFEPSLLQRPQKSIVQSYETPNSARSKLGLSSAKSSPKSVSSIQITIKSDPLADTSDLSTQDLLSSISARVCS
jgi:hypothetical protein